MLFEVEMTPSPAGKTIAADVGKELGNELSDGSDNGVSERQLVGKDSSGKTAVRNKSGQTSKLNSPSSMLFVISVALN